MKHHIKNLNFLFTSKAIYFWRKNFTNTELYIMRINRGNLRYCNTGATLAFTPAS